MIKYIIISLFLVSCAKIQYLEDKYPYNFKNELEVKDYREHLERVANIFIKNNRRKLTKVSTYRNRYLIELVEKIKRSNEIILKRDTELKIYIVEDHKPYIFSLPEGYYFISRGLVNNYVRSEDIFISMFVYEYLRNELTIYKKMTVIPYEQIGLSKIMQITNLDLKTRNELNILTYKVLKRSGFDPEARLLWIQMVNKNSIDFSIMYESPNIVPKEEYLFKNYISENKSDSFEFDRNSSKSFYNFRKRLRRKK